MKIRNDQGVRSTDPTALLVLVMAIIGFVLPVVSLAGQGDATMIPINVEIRPTTLPISPDIENSIRAITRDVVQKSLPDVLSKSSRVDASASIVEQSQRGYAIEVLVMSMYKQTFTAQMSRITFVYKDGQASLVKVEPNFQPSWER